MNTCLKCGKPIITRTDRITKFCSRACANKFRIKDYSKKCLWCDKVFNPKKHPTQKYCCTSCRDKGRNTSQKVKCSVCGNEIVRKQSRLLKHKPICPKCRSEFVKRNTLRGSEHPQYVKPETFICDYCGKSFERLKSKIRKYKFCNVECRLNWQKESGYTCAEKSPTWLGGCRNNRGIGWLYAKKKARKRDNYTCQRCGITEIEYGKAMDVHHIKPYREFKDDDKSANALENLICYCNVCHQIIECENGSKVNFGKPKISQDVPSGLVSNPF